MRYFIAEKVKSIIDETLPLYSNLSNASAVINTIGNVNWCGFYIAEGEVLYVGPFQGEAACTRIPFGKGVCGTAAAKKESVIVPDVHEFEGHIACSEISASEIVVPILKNGEVAAVIDIDSPSLSRFDAELCAELEECAELLSALF